MARTFLDGSSQYLQQAAVPVGLTWAPITVSFWSTALDANVTLDQFPFTISDASAANDYYAVEYHPGDRMQAAYRTPSSTAHVTDLPTPHETAWHHFGSSYNGLFGGSAAQSAISTDHTLINQTDNLVAGGTWNTTTIGMFEDSTDGHYANGDIGPLTLWNVAVSDAELTELNSGRDPRRIANFPVAYFPMFGGAAAANENDVVGGLALTPTNNPAATSQIPLGW